MPDLTDFSILALNENSLKIDFGGHKHSTLKPTPELCQGIAYCRSRLLHCYPNIILDCVASYTSLTIYYDFLSVDREQFIRQIHECLNSQDNNITITRPTKQIEIPVYYGPETGPDLATIAATHTIDPDQIIRLHSQQSYTVYALGFAPGFAYMGFVDKRIATPRLSSPRPKVLQGSVGIAGSQTGIYPKQSPGGWNIIGRTASELIDLGNPSDSASLLSVGDSVKFIPISRKEFIRCGGELA